MQTNLSPNKQPSNREGAATASPCDIADIRYFIEGFVLHQRSRRHSRHTVTFYTDRLGRFVWFLEHVGYPTAMESITPNHLRHFLIYLSEQTEGRWGSTHPLANRPLAPASIHAFAKALRAFFRWASREARLPHNPFDNVAMPALPNQWKVETFTDDEVATMFAALDTIGNPYMVQRNRTILAILLDSGLRASELLSLKVGDIDPHDGAFTVTGKGGKARTAIIGTFARRELWAYLARHRLKLGTDEPALFLSQGGGPLTYNGLRILFYKLRAKTGITRVGVHAHICRHTAATMMHRNGMRGATLQEVLGHSKFDTTRRFYLDVSTEDLKHEHERYGPLDHMRDELRRDNKHLLPGTERDCSGLRRPDLPPASVLSKQVAQSGYRAVGRKYGVSDTAIRKRLRKAGLL